MSSASKQGLILLHCIAKPLWKLSCQNLFNILFPIFFLTEMKNSKWFLYMWIFDTYLDRILYGVLNMKNLVLLLVFISWTEAQFSQNNYQGAGFLVQNPCVSKQTCSECLQTPTCAWCMKEVSIRIWICNVFVSIDQGIYKG